MNLNLCLFQKYMKSFLLSNSVISDSGKFRVLDELLEHFGNRGDRVLLFSQFTSVLDIMENYLTQKSLKYLRLDGSTAVPER